MRLLIAARPLGIESICKAKKGNISNFGPTNPNISSSGPRGGVPELALVVERHFFLFVVDLHDEYHAVQVLTTPARLAARDYAHLAGRKFPLEKHAEYRCFMQTLPNSIHCRRRARDRCHRKGNASGIDVRRQGRVKNVLDPAGMQRTEINCKPALSARAMRQALDHVSGQVGPRGRTKAFSSRIASEGLWIPYVAVAQMTRQGQAS